MGKETYTYLTPALVTVAACTFGAYLIWKQKVTPAVHPSNTNEVVVMARNRRTEVVVDDRAHAAEGKKSVHDSNYYQQVPSYCQTSLREVHESAKTPFTIGDRRHSCSDLPKEGMPENPESIVESTESGEIINNNVVTLVDLRQIPQPKIEVTQPSNLFQNTDQKNEVPDHESIKAIKKKDVSSSDLFLDAGSMNELQDLEFTGSDSPWSSGYEIEMVDSQSKTAVNNKSLQPTTSQEYVSRQEVISPDLDQDFYSADEFPADESNITKSVVLPLLNESSETNVTGSESNDSINKNIVISQNLPQTSAHINKVEPLEQNDNVINNRVSHSDDIRKDQYILGTASRKEEEEDHKSLSNRNSCRRSWSYRESSLYSAMRDGNLQAVESLLREGASIDFTDIQGQCPIHLAAASGNIGLMEMLVSKGVDLSLNDMFGYTVLHRAALAGQTEAISWLHGRGGGHLEDTSWAGWTPLHLAAMSGHYYSSVQLLKLGANVNAKDKDGWTPLYLAKLYKRTLIVELLQAWGGIF